MAYIVENAKPTNETTYATAEAAIEAFRAPAWDGAPIKDITMMDGNRFMYRGAIYYIMDGENPTVARREAKAKAAGIKHISDRDRAARRGGWSLSREMDREDSNY